MTIRLTSRMFNAVLITLIVVPVVYIVADIIEKGV